LMVLALARSDIFKSFPNIWAGTEMQEIALSRLTPRAAERLVHEVFDEQLAPDVAARIIAHADGNAFYLEEILRHVAENHRNDLPETVIALVQSRVERLEPEGRRIMRAASIFGEVFWRGGLAAVLGPNPGAHELDRWLRILQERELLVAVDARRFPGEPEFEFRHGLLREAAYAMLTDADRAAGHASAGDWLEQLGERDSPRCIQRAPLCAVPPRAAYFSENTPNHSRAGAAFRCMQPVVAVVTAQGMAFG
jgi:predicted ATPase